LPHTTRRAFNPINAIGSQFKNIFTWFKAGKKQEGELDFGEFKESP